MSPWRVTPLPALCWPSSGPGIKRYEKLFLMGVEQKLVLWLLVSLFSYSDSHGEDRVVTSIEWIAWHFGLE